MTAADALQPAIIYLGAGLAAAVASRAARMSPIVGYLLVGLVIGPSGMSLVEDNDATHFLAELGVAFLLFDIGLHFSVKDFSTRRDDILRLAPLQMGLCALGFAAIGFAFGLDPMLVLVISIALALSSTAVVGRILSDRNTPGCPIGRSAMAVLVAQDIVAIFLLVLAASIGGDPDSLGLGLTVAFAKAALALIIALLAGHYLVRPLFGALATTNNQEAFTVVALFIVLAGSAATAGFGLSLTLGAFLAGMAISETPYRHTIQTEVKPFGGLLLGLFFMSVGMSVNVPALYTLWPAVILAAIVIMALKTGLTLLAVSLARRTTPSAIQLSSLLSQGSEFALVVLAVPAVAGGLPDAFVGVLVAAVATTLAAAPIWTGLGVQAARWAANRSKSAPAPAPSSNEATTVLVFGMTEEGRFAVDALRDHQISYIAIDNDPERFVAATSDGYDVVYGDVADYRLMETLNAAHARAIVLGRPATGNAAGALNAERYPEAVHYVAATSMPERFALAASGLRAHVALAEPRGVELATDLLTGLGVDQSVVASWIEEQAALRGVSRSTQEDDITEPTPA
ncbi:potassium transporter KefB [bacterium]|nr:potassium transporter KefB [bacterium]